MSKIGVKVQIIFDDIVYCAIAKKGINGDKLIVQLNLSLFRGFFPQLEHKLNLNGFIQCRHDALWEDGIWTDESYEHCFSYDGDKPKEFIDDFINEVSKGVNDWKNLDEQFLKIQDVRHQQWKSGLTSYQPSSTEVYGGWRVGVKSVIISKSKIYPDNKMVRRNVSLWGYSEALRIDINFNDLMERLKSRK